MSNENPLLQRRRPLTSSELLAIPWFGQLTALEKERAASDLRVADAAVGDYVCRTGRAATYWFGVIDGLLKMSADDADGKTITFTGVAPGGWFGEGTMIKREPYRYNIQALRKSAVVGLHVDAFHWLLDNSFGSTGQSRGQR